MNGDGHVDANETDPRLNDTDGDGIHDSEDDNPLVAVVRRLAGSGPACDCRTLDSDSMPGPLAI